MLEFAKSWDEALQLSPVESATISIACAVNSFRSSLNNDIQEFIRLIYEATDTGLEIAE